MGASCSRIACRHDRRSPEGNVSRRTSRLTDSGRAPDVDEGLARRGRRAVGRCVRGLPRGAAGGTGRGGVRLPIGSANSWARDPASREDGQQRLPILNVDQSRTVVVIKRSLSPGFAGIPNPLFAADNALMLFGDGKAGGARSDCRRQGRGLTPRIPIPPLGRSIAGYRYIPWDEFTGTSVRVAAASDARRFAHHCAVGLAQRPIMPV